jgi:signal transduction histidine kinase/DNA-binding response OmpR family regulator/HAMP domain-containing protein
VRLQDVKIGTQLRLGVGAILLLTMALVALAWAQGNVLWQQTEDFHNHPMVVRLASSKLLVDVLSIQMAMRDVCLAETEVRRAENIRDLEALRADALAQFELVESRYLGPKDDVAQAFEEFGKWTALHAETLTLLETGKAAEAASRGLPTGVDGRQSNVVFARVETIRAFSIKKGEDFYRAAEVQAESLSRRLLWGTAAVVLLSVLVAAFVLRQIQAPLSDLVTVADRLRHGQLTVRSEQVSKNELGILAASLNAMADAIGAELKAKDDAALLSSAMLRAGDLRGFFHELLKALMAGAEAQVGAVYALNEAKTTYEHLESIGLSAPGRASFSATALEGEFGAALATQQIQRVAGIPADTRFAFATVSGSLVPREILTIPVLTGAEVCVVISLASVRAYSERAVRLMKDSYDVVTARVNGVLAFQRIDDLAKRLNEQNRELEVQQAELAAQTHELTEQNTELEVQKRQVDESSRLKSAFLSNMSHELRTPLNSVIALAGVLSRRLAKTVPAEEQGYLEVIERNGKNLLALINDVLDLSRIEAGKDELHLGRFSLNELAGELVAMVSPMAREKGVSLENRVPAELPLAVSDADKVRHVLQNLVGNAVKFTEHGQVVIDAAVVGAEYRVSVKDSGIGIAPDQLAIIFDEFRQADETTSRKYGGTGLGLSIARKYARLLGGDVEVSSVVGKGSTFTFKLPVAAEGHGAATVQRRVTQAPPKAGRGQTLLLVEDTEPAIVQMTEILEAEGYRVQVARDGKAALEQVAKSRPDAVLLDLMMPDVDGFQVLKELRSIPKTAELPVLILTAKHVSREELSFLTGNHIHQLIQKGDIDKTGLLGAIAEMVSPARPAPRALRRRRPARPGKPVVLVVEDNPDNLRTARALLEGHFQIVEAPDGRAGIDQARKHLPDVILMDVALPVLDGLQALAVLRQDEALRDIPVLAVTASAMTGDRESIMAHGFDAYVSKPIDYAQLMKALREQLEGFS